MNRLRVGVVGTGFIAGRHVTALSSMPEVEIVAVADEVPERATTAADRVGARSYDDGVEMMATEDLDAVWLCVPPFAHGKLEQAALDHDLPFFVEKPLAVDLSLAQQISDDVGAQGLRTAVGYHWRYLDVVEQARAQLHDRAPQLLVGQWLDATPAAPWWSKRGTSGGQLVEQTTHLFDLARLFCGEVDTVVAAESTVERVQWPEADVPTVSTVMLRFTSGALGTISSSCLLDGRHRVGLRLVAPGRALVLRERALSDHELVVDDEVVARSDQDPIATEDRAFVRALLGLEDDVRVPYDEALRTHALVCAADRSARTGTPVYLGGTDV
ncbi:MAG: oxidoreductase domain protein [Marmoricola sp.]|nr:oxidoreductase domain protein [Marmoricola sp.]